MEEKLYFKPAKYGKGIKTKEKLEQKEESRKNHRTRNLIIFLLIVILAILVILWLLHGRTTTTGQYPENVKNEAVTCYAENLKMTKITSVDSGNKHIRVNAIFKGESELKTLAFEYTLVYPNNDEAYNAEAVSHAELNKSLAAAGYSTDKFDNKFARYNNSLIISLFANKGELDEISAPYFMIMLNDQRAIPQTMQSFVDNYESQGFSCTKTTE